MQSLIHQIICVSTACASAMGTFLKECGSDMGDYTKTIRSMLWCLGQVPKKGLSAQE